MTAALACRRCGEISDDQVIIYGPGLNGTLLPKQAECRRVCARTAQQRPRYDRRGGTGPFASRRGADCAGCDLDIVPGDRIVRDGDAHYHEACTLAQPQRRERIRTRGT